MSRKKYSRYVRHRSFSGLTRGSVRSRLRHFRNWVNRLTNNTPGNGGLSGTATPFAVTANNATNEFTGTSHGLELGEAFQVSGTAVPTGVAVTTDYYTISVDANTFKLASSNANALAGVEVAFSDNGTAVQVTRQIDEDAIVSLLRAGVKPEQLEAATDIDNI